MTFFFVSFKFFIKVQVFLLLFFYNIFYTTEFACVKNWKIATTNAITKTQHTPIPSFTAPNTWRRQTVMKIRTGVIATVSFPYEPSCPYVGWLVGYPNYTSMLFGAFFLFPIKPLSVTHSLSSLINLFHIQYQLH